jgi:hypothetical protein
MCDEGRIGLALETTGVKSQLKLELAMLPPGLLAVIFRVGPSQGCSSSCAVAFGSLACAPFAVI